MDVELGDAISKLAMLVPKRTSNIDRTGSKGHRIGTHSLVMSLGGDQVPSRRHIRFGGSSELLVSLHDAERVPSGHFKVHTLPTVRTVPDSAQCDNGGHTTSANG